MVRVKWFIITLQWMPLITFSIVILVLFLWVPRSRRQRGLNYMQDELQLTFCKLTLGFSSEKTEQVEIMSVEGLPIIPPRTAPLSPPVCSGHFILSCDLTRGHAIWWSGGRCPSYFWILQLPLGKGMTWFQLLVVNCCPPWEHPGRSLLFQNTGGRSQASAFGVFSGISRPSMWMWRALAQGWERHWRGLCLGERAVAVWVRSREE